MPRPLTRVILIPQSA